MKIQFQQPKEKGSVISTLNGFIEVLNVAKEIASNTPAKGAFGSAIVILTMVRVSHLLFFCRADCEHEYA